MFAGGIFVAALLATASQPQLIGSSPGGLPRFELVPGETGSNSLVVYSNEDAPFEIVGAESSNKRIGVRYAKIETAGERVPEGRKSQNQYRVTVSVDARDEIPGPVAGFVTIRTNSERQPELTVTVIGTIRRPYEIVSGDFNFGVITPTSAPPIRKLLLRSNSRQAPERFKVTHVDSGISMLKLRVDEIARGSYEIVAELPQTHEEPRLNGIVTVHFEGDIEPRRFVLSARFKTHEQVAADKAEVEARKLDYVECWLRNDTKSPVTLEIFDDVEQRSLGTIFLAAGASQVLRLKSDRSLDKGYGAFTVKERGNIFVWKATQVRHEDTRVFKGFR